MASQPGHIHCIYFVYTLVLGYCLFEVTLRFNSKHNTVIITLVSLVDSDRGRSRALLTAFFYIVFLVWYSRSCRGLLSTFFGTCGLKCCWSGQGRKKLIDSL